MKQHINLWLTAFCVVFILAACSAEGPDVPEPQESLGNLRTQTVLLPGHSEPNEVTFEVRDGKALFEGDIILGEVDEEGYLIDDGLGGGELDPQALIIKRDSYRWPDGIVPYVVDYSQFPALQRVAISNAIMEWNNKTAVRLVERTTQKDYVKFVPGKGCSSEIGRRGGMQEIILDLGCGFGTIVHEIGHAVGLWHEHSRADRDTYVTIHYDNVDNGSWWNPFDGKKYQFDKHISDGMDDGPYDYSSIMHYDCKAFSANGKNTITPKDPDVGCSKDEGKLKGYIGQRDGLSAGDIAAINALYAFTMPPLGTTDFNCDAPAVCKLADVNKDGMDDVIRFVRSSQSGAGEGDVYVARSSGGKWNAPTKWHDYVCGRATEVCDTGDFNGDGAADVIAFHRGTYGGSSEVWVALSNGSTAFGAGKKWASGFCIQPKESCMTGDFNGDGKDDIITFHNGAWNGSKEVYVYLSNGSSFYYPGKPWHKDFCGAGETCAVGDVNGDDMDDIISFTGKGQVYVALSYGTEFGPKQKWHDNFCFSSKSLGAQIKCTVGDVDGDGRADLLAFAEAPWTKYTYIPGVGTIPESCTYDDACGDVYIARSRGLTFGDTYKSHGTFLMHDSDTVLVGQIDNDSRGRADLLAISTYHNKYMVLLSQMR